MMLAGHATPLVGSRGHYVVPVPSQAQVEVVQRYADWIQMQYVLS
jgi:hypothetical protein